MTISKLIGLSTRDDLLGVWRDGQVPSSDNLLGENGTPCEWRVDMLTGPIPNMGGWPLHHRKIFWRIDLSESGRTCGLNIFGKGWGWGSFYVVPAEDRALFGYDLPDNSVPLRKIRDEARTTSNPNILIGQFYYRLPVVGYWGPYYFSLTRLPSR